MGYERRYIPRYDFEHDELLKDLIQPGHSYKLCPWSAEYRDKFQYDGAIITSYDSNNQPVYQNGLWVVGNSVDPSFKQAYASYLCSEHTATSGRMFTLQNPPGWICLDPNCYYYTSINSGERYKEV